MAIVDFQYIVQDKIKIRFCEHVVALSTLETVKLSKCFLKLKIDHAAHHIQKYVDIQHHESSFHF